MSEFFIKGKPGKVSYLIKKINNPDFTIRQAYSRLGLAQNIILLESGGPSSKIAQYSFLCFDPFHLLKFNESLGDPFDCLRQIFNKFYDPTQIDIDLPYFGGPAGYFSYDIARYIEKLPNLTIDDLGIDKLAFIFPRQILAFNHKTNVTHIIINEITTGNNTKHKAQSRLNETLTLLAAPKDHQSSFSVEKEKIDYSLNKYQFCKAVKKIKDYIYAGDVYQVNLSQRFEIPFMGSPFDLYDKLMHINPSPFSCFLDFGDFQLASSSPERLIQLKNGLAQTRPIAGTRRRGDGIDEDKYLSGHLLLDEKEQAEHIMLLDLERNDLGRVCDYHSIKVNELMTVEKYSHVIHIVSNVCGRLAKEKDQFSLLKAVFPGGTITGCPKVRCLEIIEELEGNVRGLYTGSVGYFGSSGNIDFNIIIRSFVLKDNMAYIQAGAGIVADSVPKREYFETLSKAQALFTAIGVDLKEVQWEKLSI